MTLRHLLSILDIPFQLEFSTETSIPLSDNLNQCVVTKPTTIPPTTVKVVTSPISFDSSEKPLGHDTPSLSMVTKKNGYLYYSYMYQLLADATFKNVRLWSPNEESLSVQRENKIAYDGIPTLLFAVWGRAAQHGLLFFHGALNVFNGSYFLLSGDSGVGKSTLSNIICSAGGTCLTDENPYLGIEESKVFGYSTPWPGTRGAPAPPKGLLKGIFFLHHAKSNTINRLPPKESFRKLLHNSRTFNWQPQTIPESLALIEKVVQDIPCYSLGFVPDKSALELIEKVV